LDTWGKTKETFLFSASKCRIFERKNELNLSFVLIFSENCNWRIGFFLWNPWRLFQKDVK
jgi:hypothetical protein